MATARVCRQHVCAVVASLVVLAAWQAGREPVSACLYPAPDPALDGTPADGDRDVPTDVVPFYRYPYGVMPSFPIDTSVPPTVPGNFTLHAADGSKVDLQARHVDVWSYELQPKRALAPNTAYTLRGEWSANPMTGQPASSDEVHFTTGPGPLSAPPAAPVASLQHYRLVGDVISSCGPEPVGTCASVADERSIVLATYIDVYKQEQSTYDLRGSSFITNLSGVDQHTPDSCVKLRARAANGVLSEPTLLCGADFGAPVEFPVTASIRCTSMGVVEIMPVAAAAPDASVAPAAPDASVAPVSPDASVPAMTPDAALAGQVTAVPDAATAQASPADAAATAPPSAAAGASAADAVLPSMEAAPVPDADGCSTVPGHKADYAWFVCVVWLLARRRERALLQRKQA
jgi:hypothetical protein